MKSKLNYRTIRIFVFALALLCVFYLAQVAASQAPTGLTLRYPFFSQLGSTAQVPGLGQLQSTSFSIAGLTPRDYQEIYDEAQKFLKQSKAFRETKIQLIAENKITTITDVLQNYREWNDGESFYSFCLNYDAIDEQGYCPQATLQEMQARFGADLTEADINIRNQLLRAQSLFAVLLIAEPGGLVIEDELGNAKPARELGGNGLLEATREIAKVHMIFGNEFLVDALDYRFSSQASNDGETIINQELSDLEEAHEQFTFASDILARTFNTSIGWPTLVYVSDLFTAQEFELFGMTSDRTATVLDEYANRLRQLNRDADAMSRYTAAAVTQYVQGLALARKAQDLGIDFLDHGGLELITGLERLQAHAQAIQYGYNPFGYPEKYVPLQTYHQMFTIASALLDSARRAEQDAEDKQRLFETNFDTIGAELLALEEKYTSELIGICGTQFVENCENPIWEKTPEEAVKLCTIDNPQQCSGLMVLNYIDMLVAHKQVEAARQEAENIYTRMKDEQQRANKVFEIITETGKRIGALDYLIALNSSYSVSESETTTTSHNISASRSVSVGFPQLISVGGQLSYNYSVAHTSGRSVSWNPHAPEIAHLTELRDTLQAAERAQIVREDSQVLVRQYLRDHAQALVDVELAVLRFNRLAAEHNTLVERYQNLKDLRAQAERNVVNSSLSNPIFRLLRNQLTLAAARRLDVAARFAYLTAKALEYEKDLVPMEGIKEIFKARTSADIQDYLDRVKTEFELQRPIPECERVQISIAKNILGLTDAHLDPDGNPNDGIPGAQALADMRFERFQAFLQEHLEPHPIRDGEWIRFTFSTSLEDGGLFSLNRFNQRITGVGQPFPNANGVYASIFLDGVTSDVGRPEVLLEQAGHTTYRRKNGQIVEYTPASARLFDHDQDIQEPAVAVITASINGNYARGSRSSALFNRSVAASDWTFYIDLTLNQNSSLKRELDQISDIEILMDATGYGLVPGLPISPEAAQVGECPER
jgi:hypothetical protein